MNKCIYCLNEDAQASFTSRDHIVLRNIGGLNRLPIGFVCDECNQYFSVLERRFIYDSIMAIPKQFRGPSGRSGVYQTRLHLIMFDSNNLGLGYIEQGGYPYLAPQFKYINEKETAFSANEKDKTDFGAIFVTFKDLCSTTVDESIIFITDDRIEPNHPILAMFKGKLFAGINNESDKPLLFNLKESTKTTTPTPSDLASSKTTISYVTSHQSLSFSLDEHFRIVGKMLLNCLAMHFSQETALHTTFNDFRKYVRFGSNTSKFSYVSIIPKFDGHSIYENLSSGLKLNDNSHLLLCGNVNQENNVFGIVSLYSGGFEYAIRLQSTYGNLFDSMPLRLLHVDYEAKKEYEIIKMIITESGKLQEDMFRTT